MAILDQPAPPLDVDRWVQGSPQRIGQNRGRVILIEVFQVNCPGCFLRGLPETIDIFLQSKDKPLVVWGLATAFEDYRLNSLSNLEKLLETGEVVGETFHHLAERDFLNNGRLPYAVPFPVAWDKIAPRHGEIRDGEIEALLARDFPQFDELSENHRHGMRQQVTAYLKKKEYDAVTFDAYQLKGTPSSILIDKQGILRHKVFGSGQELADLVDQLLNEPFPG
ncbi:MAG: TlpA family protein disulfide reductase [Nitrospinaceae bacterium]